MFTPKVELQSRVVAVCFLAPGIGASGPIVGSKEGVMIDAAVQAMKILMRGADQQRRRDGAGRSLSPVIAAAAVPNPSFDASINVLMRQEHDLRVLFAGALAGKRRSAARSPADERMNGFRSLHRMCSWAASRTDGIGCLAAICLRSE